MLTLNPLTEVSKFSATVEKIYDAAVDSTQWSNALDHVVELVGGSSAAMHFGNADADNLALSRFYSVGLSDEFNLGMAQYAEIWCLQVGVPFWNVGEVHHLPDVLPREEFLNGRFYREFLRHQNQDDYIGMVALKDGPRFVPMAITTDKEVGAFPKHSVELVRLLARHICKAAKISFALELKSLNINMLETTLNSLSAGIFLVQGNGHIVFMNNAAERQMKRGNGINIRNNQIVPKDAAAAKHLLRSLSSVGQNEGATSVSIALPDELGGMLATILPLNNGQRQNLAVGAKPALYAVFVQDPEVSPPMPGEGFAKLYNLTPSELRIVLAMAPGLGPQDAADILGLSLSTVKSHLQNIFSKTGAGRQADLMQLLMRSSAPLAAN